MKLKFDCCIYMKEDEIWFRNMSLSGCRGIGSLVGKHLLITKGNDLKEEYILLSATKEELKEIQIGDRVHEFQI